MSEDFEQPREANGQFAPADTGVHGWIPQTDVGEQAYGEEAIERSLGYTPNINAHVSADEVADEFSDERIAVDALFPQDAEAPVVDGITELSAEPATYINKTNGKPLHANVTLKEEEAGNDLVAYEASLANAVDYVEGVDLQAVVDQRRAEELKANPDFAEEAGLDKAQVEANAQKAPEATPQPEATSTRQPNESEYDFAARQILDNPLATQVLKDQLAATHQAQANYVAQLGNAVRVAELSFLNQFPEFRGVTDMNHLESIASSIKAQNPQRWAQIGEITAQNGQLLQAQAVEQQRQAEHRAAQAEQQLQAYKAQEDAAFTKSVGKVSNAEVEAVRDYLTDVLGMSQQDIGQLSRNPTAIDHRFQRALLDAGRFHRLSNAPKAVASRSNPSVQKPGNPDFRSTARELSIAQLEHDLARTGSEEAGWRLLQAKMRGR
jgi:hypothetical protein